MLAFALRKFASPIHKMSLSLAHRWNTFHEGFHKLDNIIHTCNLGICVMLPCLLPFFGSNCYSTWSNEHYSCFHIYEHSSSSIFQTWDNGAFFWRYFCENSSIGYQKGLKTSPLWLMVHECALWCNNRSHNYVKLRNSAIGIWYQKRVKYLWNSIISLHYKCVIKIEPLLIYRIQFTVAHFSFNTRYNRISNICSHVGEIKLEHRFQNKAIVFARQKQSVQMNKIISAK